MTHNLTDIYKMTVKKTKNIRKIILVKPITVQTSHNKNKKLLISAIKNSLLL